MFIVHQFVSVRVRVCDSFFGFRGTRISEFRPAAKFKRVRRLNRFRQTKLDQNLRLCGTDPFPLGAELLADQLQAGGHVVAMPQFGPILHAGAEYFPAAGTFRAVELGVEGPGVLRGQPAADDIGDGAVDGLLRCQRQGGHAAQQLLRMIRLMRGSLPRLR